MKKEITLGTRIVFTATGEKYSIIEQTATGFQFKPIKFEKGLATVPRTFEEVKDEFLSSQIDIDNFEHNDADNRLVELIMDGYIKASEIENYKEEVTRRKADGEKQRAELEESKSQYSILNTQYSELQTQYSELQTQYSELQTQYSELQTQYSELDSTVIAHEATISEQQDAIQEQKDFMQGQKDFIQGQKDTIQKQIDTLKITFETTEGLGKQISELRTELEKEKQAHATDKGNWNAEEEKYKTTIEGLEASMSEA